MANESDRELQKKAPKVVPRTPEQAPREVEQKIKIRPLMRSVVKAKDIVQALTQDENGPLRIVLRHKKILGKLDLKHRLIKIPLTFKNCDFLGEVDLRNCEFEQAVDFTGCTFYQEFNSGDETECHTVYKKDLICNEANFKGDVNFVASNFESSASFSKAVFHGWDKTIDFQLSSIGQFLRCDGAIFEGSVDFRGLKCSKIGFFRPAEVVVDGEEKYSRSVTFKREVKFRFASFGMNLQCDRATFEDQADFSFMTCGNHAIFRHCNFESEWQEVSLFGATLGGTLECDGATFKGPANFSAIKCGTTASFLPVNLEVEDGKGTHPVTFEKAVQFRFASLGANLECNQAIFRDQVDLSFLKCGSNAIFTLCNFEGEWQQEVNFREAALGGNLECGGATFKGPTNFSAIKCGGAGLFNSTEVQHEEGVHTRSVSFGQTADFRFSNFAMNLEFIDATFEESVNFVGVQCRNNMFLSSARFQDEGGSVEFTRASIEGTLYCDGQATFQGRTILYNATLGILTLGDDVSFAPGGLDLRELTFKRFDGKREQAERFVEAQDPTLFSRDPYIQLELYYRSVGKDALAKDIYYQGHAAARDNAKKPSGSTEWGPGTSALDWLWKTLTRYGVSPWRLLAIAISFVVVGTLVFYLPDGLLSVDTLKLASDSARAAPWEEGWLYLAAYSFDLFIPLVNLQIDTKWMPNGPILQAYAMFHTMVGWLIVPLLIAALAGIMRR